MLSNGCFVYLQLFFGGGIQLFIVKHSALVKERHFAGFTPEIFEIVFIKSGVVSVPKNICHFLRWNTVQQQFLRVLHFLRVHVLLQGDTDFFFESGRRRVRGNQVNIKKTTIFHKKVIKKIQKYIL